MDKELNRIKLNNVSAYIGLKDIKSIEAWCKKSGVLIHIQGNRKYVFLQQVQKALANEFIDAAIKEEPTKYIDVCKDYVSSTTLEEHSFSASTFSTSVKKQSFTRDYSQDILDFVNKL